MLNCRCEFYNSIIIYMYLVLEFFNIRNSIYNDLILTLRESLIEIHCLISISQFVIFNNIIRLYDRVTKRC